jgi:FPC/CPF motif-containing protein YcgG
MRVTDSDDIIHAFHEFIGDQAYPCVAARAAVSRQHLPCLIAGHMGCPADDHRILGFLYDFVANFHQAHQSLHSAAVIFQGPDQLTETLFDTLLWQRLQSLSDLDAKTFAYDHRVDPDPSSVHFSYSLGKEAFFIIGLHSASSRRSRQFKYPAMVFNPHVQFQQLRETNRYEKMKDIVRQRDILYSGSVNPMLSDYGEAPEVYQYSGKQYDRDWKCPLKRRA